MGPRGGGIRFGHPDEEGRDVGRARDSIVDAVVAHLAHFLSAACAWSWLSANASPRCVRGSPP